MLHPRNPPNPETQIPRNLVVQIQIEILVQFEFVLKNSSVWIGRMSGCIIFGWNCHSTLCIMKKHVDICLIPTSTRCWFRKRPAYCVCVYVCVCVCVCACVYLYRLDCLILDWHAVAPFDVWHNSRSCVCHIAMCLSAVWYSTHIGASQGKMICTSIYIYIYIYIYEDVFVKICVKIYVYIYVNIYIYVWMNIYI